MDYRTKCKYYQTWFQKKINDENVKLVWASHGEEQCPWACGMANCCLNCQGLNDCLTASRTTESKLCKYKEDKLRRFVDGMIVKEKRDG